MKIGKRLAAFVVMLTMVMTMMPVQAFAVDDNPLADYAPSTAKAGSGISEYVSVTYQNPPNGNSNSKYSVKVNVYVDNAWKASQTQYWKKDSSPGVIQKIEPANEYKYVRATLKDYDVLGDTVNVEEGKTSISDFGYFTNSATLSIYLTKKTSGLELVNDVVNTGCLKVQDKTDGTTPEGGCIPGSIARTTGSGLNSRSRRVPP